MIRSSTGRGNRIYWGWVVAGSSAFLIFLTAGTAYYGNAVYLVPLQHAFGVSRGAISRTFAIISLLTGLLMPLVGAISDRYGPRRALLVGFVGLAAAFLLLSRMTKVWHFYLLIVLQGLFQPFSAGLPNQAIIGRWFVQKRGRAMGIVGAGIGLGGLVLPWSLGVIIERHGFRSAYLFSAVLIACVAIPVALLLIRDDPGAMGLVPDGTISKSGNESAPKRQGQYFRHTVRLTSFWLILAAASCTQITIGIVSLHLPAMMQDAGLPLSTSAAVLGIALGISVPGRLLVGALSDRVRPRYLFIAACAGMGISVLLLLRPENAAMRTVFVFSYGMFQGATATLTAIVIHSLFGGRAFGRIYGLVLFAAAGAGAIGNALGGYIFDTRGSYQLAVVLASCLGVVAAILSALARFKREGEY